MYSSFTSTILKNSVSLLSRFRKVPKPLGRWSIDKSNTSVSMINYYNNVDHCGTCDYQTKMIQEILKEKEKEKEK